MTEQELKDLEMVKKDGYALKFVKNQTEEICLAAVKQNCSALEYVKNQTEEMCLVAVNRYSLAFMYVKKQTEQVCLAAVKQIPNGRLMCYIIDDKIFFSITNYKELSEDVNNPFLF